MQFFGADTTPISVLDLGSYQARVLIATPTKDGQLDTLGYSQRKTVGVRGGQIIDPKSAGQSIADAVASAESLAGVNVQQLSVALNSPLTESLTITLEKPLEGQPVDADMRQELRDLAVNQIQERLAKNYPEVPQWEHLHTIALGYSIDGSQVTDFPDGLYGNTLRVHYHIVSVPLTVVKNLTECLARNRLKVERFVLAPYAACLCALPRALREHGAILVDLGADTTSIVAFGGWKLLRSVVLPFGGNDMTRDLAQQLGLSHEQAEKLKVTQGNLAAGLSASTALEAATLFDARSFEQADLNPLIEARMHDIFQIVGEKLASPTFAEYQTHTLVFSGAGSHIKGLGAYAETLFHNRRIQLAAPAALPGAPKAIQHAGFATAAGLLRYIDKWRAQTGRPQTHSGLNSLNPQNIPVVRRLFAK